MLTEIYGTDAAPACACGSTVATYHATPITDSDDPRDSGAFEIVATCDGCRSHRLTWRQRPSDQQAELSATFLRLRHEERVHFAAREAEREAALQASPQIIVTHIGD